MIKKIYFGVVLFLLVISLTSSVRADFVISSDTSEENACIGSSTVISDKVSGDNGEYTTEISGSAANFVTIVPPTFSLSGTQNVYAYITPTTKITPGTYELIVKIKSGNTIKEQKHTITVKDCHGAALTTEQDKKTCPCSTVKYNLLLENLGKFEETFKFEAAGTAKAWINFSKEGITLNSGENAEIYAYVTPPCDVYGKYALQFNAITSSFAKASASSTLEILPCYEYDITLDKEYSICDNKKTEIPLKISNKGTSNNTFDIIVGGPNWISSKNNTLGLEAGAESILQVEVQPPLGTEGSFKLNAEAMSTLGSVNKKAEAEIKVRKCFGSKISLEKNADSLCIEEKAYNLSIGNSGEENESYSLALEGPEWASLEENAAEISPNESKIIQLLVNPVNITPGEYAITVKIATSQSKEEFTQKLVITLPKQEECYSADITTEKDKIAIGIERSKTVNVLIKNNGLIETSYFIELTGDGAKFALINPTAISLKPNETTTLYLYNAIPLYTEPKEYDLGIKVTETASDREFNKALKLNVVEADENSTELGEKLETGNFFTRSWNKIKLFIKNLFFDELKSPSTEQITTKIISDISNQSIENETALINQSEILNISEELNVTQETLENISVSEESNETNLSIETNLTLITESTENKTANSSISEGSNTNVSQDELELEERAKEIKPVKFSEFAKGNWSYVLSAMIIVLAVAVLVTGFWKPIAKFVKKAFK